ncbi:MAG: hypothetical protein OEW08_11600 [Gammaproteobacteria bacterium]|nr:hypothetical protein [Gammaproteobacteria bacterium]
MRLSNPKRVFDLDDFLPPDGETKFEMFFSEGVLNLDIFYETDGSEARVSKRRIRFPQAKYFFKTPFPGYSFFSCPDDRELSLLNSLVNYEQSEMLDMERNTSGLTDYKHFRLFLHSSGAAIHVVSQSCEMLGEELVGRS